MQVIEIKSGTSAKIYLTPKINGTAATAEQMAGVKVYVFFVHQYTNKIHGEPYILTGEQYSQNGTLMVNLSPRDTIEMLGNAAENQKYEIQFAIKNADGNVISEERNSSVVINITRWEAGQWIYQESIK